MGLKEGGYVKKIVVAWIEQILEFPTKLEYLAYIESLKKGKPQKFKFQYAVCYWSGCGE